MLVLLLLIAGCGGTRETHAQSATPSAAINQPVDGAVAQPAATPQPTLSPATPAPTSSPAPASSPTPSSGTVLLPLVIAAAPAADSVRLDDVTAAIAVTPTAASPVTSPVTVTLAITDGDVAALLNELAPVDSPPSGPPPQPPLPVPGDANSPLAVLLTAVAAPLPAPGSVSANAPAIDGTPAPPAANVDTTDATAAASDSEIVDALLGDDANSAALVTPTLEIAPEVAPLPGPPPPMPAVNRALLPGDGVARTVEVPVLMYHYLSEPPAGANIYRVDLSVAPNRFVEHLDALRGAGYTTISLYDLYNHLLAGAPLPARPVVLTFDDGYRDNYFNAFPRLRERGMTATFFVVTDFMDAGREEYITWEMAREMQAAGMYIESHGRDHTTLQNREADYLVWQALGSQETIQFELGIAPRFVSYPAGEYDEATINVFRSAGYVAGFTTRQGDLQRSDDPFRLSRIRVRNTTTAEELLSLLEADWSNVEGGE